MSTLRGIAVLAGALLLPAPLCAQSFTQVDLLTTSGAPTNASSTNNVDFGDVDLDGDWDVAMADGGDTGNDQNRVWINLGGLQGGSEGTFEDQTNARFPAVADTSRDVEFADIDSDADLDLYIANTSSIQVQASRWWINQGGEPGGLLGYYADQTGQRWIDLGGPNSSIPDGFLLPDPVNPKAFITWSCDADFADLDSDGDLDLVHSSYGSAFGGGIPTRLFLNDGGGYFSEFNPSGYQLPGMNIPDGAPGLWCEGTQTSDTTATDGSECDVASSPEEVDLGDVDGDFDLDLLLGGRNHVPRVFTNRSAEDGDLGFRDTTYLAFPPANFPGGHASVLGNYDQEWADFDGDNDLDLYGMNWKAVPSSFDDLVAENVGGGVFGSPQVLAGSGTDDKEGDAIDFDNDGDLDLVLGSWGGPDHLYRNDTAGAGLVFTGDHAQLPIVSSETSMDIDVCDVDGDGDYDFLDGTEVLSPNRFFVNTTQIPDTTAPRVAPVEAVAGHAAAPGPDRVRAHVYDNAPDYLTYFNDTRIEVEVDGVALPDAPMRSSGAQVFRGELPGNLVGDVTYRVVSSDEYGNTGSSADRAYTNTGPTGSTQGGTSPGPAGPPTLRTLTSPFAGAPLHLVASNASPGAPGLYLVSLAGVVPGGLDLGDGLVLNVQAPFATSPILGVADANGDLLLSVARVGPAATGLSFHFQTLFADGAGGNTWSSTPSLTVAFP